MPVSLGNGNITMANKYIPIQRHMEELIAKLHLQCNFMALLVS